MKVAFIVDAFPLPSETFVVDQVRGACERGHAVDIYALRRSDGGYAASVPVPRGLHGRVRHLEVPAGVAARMAAALEVLGRAGWRAPGLCARALNVFRYRREALTLRLLCMSLPFLIDGTRTYDVIHCQFGPLGRLAMRLRQLGALRGALVTTFRGYDATKYLRRYPHAYDELFREGDLFLPVSDALRHVLLAQGAEAGKVKVLHSGVDTAKFAFQPRTRTANEPTRVISVGRLTEKKGIEYGIRAAAHLVRADCPLIYDIIGDGELRAPLERLIARLDMARRIRLLGWRGHDEVAALLRDGHILIAPSVTAADGDQEGIATVLQEAMAVGIPVVATLHGGTSELVEDGVSGFLVPERDVEALAQRIGELAAHPERWPAMGRAGRARVESEFDVHRLNDRLENYYVRLAATAAAARGSPVHA